MTSLDTLVTSSKSATVISEDMGRSLCGCFVFFDSQCTSCAIWDHEWWL